MNEKEPGKFKKEMRANTNIWLRERKCKMWNQEENNRGKNGRRLKTYEKEKLKKERQKYSK